MHGVIFSDSVATLLSVYIATFLPVGASSSGSCSSAFRIAICSAWLFEQLLQGLDKK